MGVVVRKGSLLLLLLLLWLRRLRLRRRLRRLLGLRQESSG